MSRFTVIYLLKNRDVPVHYVSLPVKKPGDMPNKHRGQENTRDATPSQPNRWDGYHSQSSVLYDIFLPT